MTVYGISKIPSWGSPSAILLGLPRQQALVFYLCIPVLIGFLAGWPQAGRTSDWPKDIAVGFWILLSVGGWWINDLFTRIGAKLLRPLRAPLFVVLIVGVLLAALPMDIYFVYVARATYLIFSALPQPEIYPDFDWNLENWFRTHTYGLVIWPTINLACFYFFRMPRFGFETATIAVPRVVPTIIARIPPRLGTDILALKAEQHYIRVYTAIGDSLVLYRFSDAVRELGAGGVQVHRGYWVSAHAVAGISCDSAAPKLTLTNGIEIPISRSFKNAARQAGILPK